MRSSEKLGLEAVAAISAWVEPGLEMARVELKQSGGEEWGRHWAQADPEGVGLALTSLRGLTISGPLRAVFGSSGLKSFSFYIFFLRCVKVVLFNFCPV